VVIACNTASQAALAQARKAFPGLIVVGTVPAVKPAAERSRSGVIGVMATAKAVGDPYLDALVARHAQGRTVLREAAQELVSFVERRFPGSSAEERRAAVLPHVERLVAAGADEIVLACTHFLHVADDIAACAASLAPGRGVEVVDSRDGVARRLKVLLSESGLAAAPSGSAPVKGSAPSMGAAKGAGREAAKEAGPPAGRDLFLLSSEPPFDGVYDSFARLYGLRGPEALGKS
ncbi:MAG TPA: aspartate/glutamate racemase family protein, partial [Spirochaetia bacterium]|nr:aspartate/glutamate racemase family protein [Spirochaetia bacterium]